MKQSVKTQSITPKVSTSPGTDASYSPTNVNHPSTPVGPGREEVTRAGNNPARYETEKSMETGMQDMGKKHHMPDDKAMPMEEMEHDMDKDMGTE